MVGQAEATVKYLGNVLGLVLRIPVIGDPVSATKGLFEKPPTARRTSAAPIFSGKLQAGADEPEGTSRRHRGSRDKERQRLLGELTERLKAQSKGRGKKSSVRCERGLTSHPKGIPEELAF